MMLIIILNIEHCRSLLVDRPGGIELCNQKCKQICALCMQTPSYMNFRLTMSLIYKVEQLQFALLLWSHISNSETFFHIFQIVGPLMAEKSWFLGTYTCSNRNKCTNKWTKCHFYRTQVYLGSGLWVQVSQTDSLMFGWLNWCNSGWWRYQLNSSWWCQ